jgi:hypothetical protein
MLPHRSHCYGTKTVFASIRYGAKTMALTPSSTFADVEAALLANITWEEDRNLTEAQAFVQAANYWLIMQPRTSGDQGYSITLNVEYVQQLVGRAKIWLNQQNIPQIKYLVPGLDWTGNY